VLVDTVLYTPVPCSPGFTMVLLVLKYQFPQPPTIFSFFPPTNRPPVTKSTVQNRTRGKSARLGELRRAEPADGQNIGVDPHMAHRGVGADRRNRRRSWYLSCATQ
jgi:hypothetical protein